MRRHRSDEGSLRVRLLGVGITEWGVLTLLDDSYLWNPASRTRSLGAREFLIERDQVVRVLHRDFSRSTTLVRVDTSDGSWVRLRLPSSGFDQTFAEADVEADRSSGWLRRPWYATGTGPPQAQPRSKPITLASFRPKRPEKTMSTFMNGACDS